MVIAFKHKPVIAFLGVDGAGKTTVMNAVLPIMEQHTGGQFVIHHLKPDLLPPLGRFRGIKHEPGWVCTNPHGSKPSGFIGSCFRLTYLMADYILGYWFKVRRKIKKQGIAGWAFDRYAYDLLMDPLRFRIKLPAWIISFGLRLVPRPDVILCLGGDSEKIYARKPETSLAEVARQVAELKKFCDKNKRAVWIDTTASIETSRDAVLAALGIPRLMPHD